MTFHRTSLLSAVALLAGCATAPPRVETSLPLPPAPAAEPIAPASGPAQTLDPHGQLLSSWWTLFDSPVLNDLVARALLANNDLATADATLRQAQQQAAAARGSLFPQIDLGYQVQRTRTSDVLSPPLADPSATLYTLHTGQLNLSYAVDLFGGVRNKVASARAAAEVQGYRLQAARMTVIANLTLAVIQQAALQAEIDATRASIASNRDMLFMLRRRQTLGAVGAADVAAQETTLASAEATLPTLQKALDHQRGLIAVLIGLAPGTQLPALPALGNLLLPSHLPAALPAEIVHRRPDILAAEAQMRGAGADLGVAIASRLPAVQLSADLGGSAARFAEMFASGNIFWSLVGSLTQPLFHGGALRHQQHAAEAALDAAKSQYRATALQAFLDVSDAMSALREDAHGLDAATRASDASSRNLRFVRRQIELGESGTLALMVASAASSLAEVQLVQARAARLADSVALIQASGGAW